MPTSHASTAEKLANSPVFLIFCICFAATKVVGDTGFSGSIARFPFSVHINGSRLAGLAHKLAARKLVVWYLLLPRDMSG